METYYGLNVFVASPGDVSEERRVCFDVIEELNEDSFRRNSKDNKLLFNLKVYERILPTVIMPHTSLQYAVDNAIPVNTLDLFICIIGNKMGTPVRDETTGRTYESGTEKEFMTAYERWKNDNSPYMKSPHILLYHFDQKPLERGSEAETQYNKVQNFLSRFASNQDHPGTVRKMSNLEDFRRRLKDDLLNYRDRYSDQIRRLNDGKIEDIWNHFAEKLYLQEGASFSPGGKVYFNYKNVFLPVTSERDQRTKDKRIIMNGVNEIRMMAHAGQSYLDIYTDRMRKEVEHCLENHGKVKIILTNPFSYSGLLISIADEAESHANEQLKRVLETLANQPSDNSKVISLIEKSRWYASKQKRALEGYENFKEAYENQIELKMLGFDMYATTLITEKGAFIEPYLIVSREERRGMATFEFQVSKNSYIYDNINENFEILWELAEPYESYLEHIDDYKKNLRSDIGMLLGWLKQNEDS